MFGNVELVVVSSSILSVKRLLANPWAVIPSLMYAFALKRKYEATVKLVIQLQLSPYVDPPSTGIVVNALKTVAASTGLRDSEHLITKPQEC